MTGEYRKSAYTIVEDISISTIFRGRDPNTSGNAPPLIFETAVFKDEKPSDIFPMVFYATWDEAVAGHDAMVLKVQGLKDREL